jgi:hypothetical protein
VPGRRAWPARRPRWPSAPPRGRLVPLPQVILLPVPRGRPQLEHAGQLDRRPRLSPRPRRRLSTDRWTRQRPSSSAPSPRPACRPAASRATRPRATRRRCGPPCPGPSTGCPSTPITGSSETTDSWRDRNAAAPASRYRPDRAGRDAQPPTAAPGAPAHQPAHPSSARHGPTQRNPDLHEAACRAVARASSGIVRGSAGRGVADPRVLGDERRPTAQLADVGPSSRAADGRRSLDDLPAASSARADYRTPSTCVL